jgi:serine/threonine protein kinase
VRAVQCAYAACAGFSGGADSRYVSGIDAALLQKYRSGTLSLADFTLVRTLGTGSFGRVMLAQHRATQHWVAIKVLRKDKVVKMKQVEHTKYEKTILDALQCPFIVNLLGSFQDAKNLYLVLEYVRGGEMFTHLRKAGRYAVRTLVHRRVWTDAADGG